MKRIIGLTILLALTAGMTAASAKVKFEQLSDTKTVYLNESGQPLTAGEAVLASLENKRVLKCSEMDVKETKNGLSLKAKK